VFLSHWLFSHPLDSIVVTGCQDRLQNGGKCTFCVQAWVHVSAGTSDKSSVICAVCGVNLIKSWSKTIFPDPGMILANNWFIREVRESSLSLRQRVSISTVQGGTEMIGVDQFIVYQWLLPVVLFIVIPLCVSAVWWPVSLLIKLIQREAEEERSREFASG
jgi:hypothetical protein